ncbi:MAG: hypothetical protein Q8M98_06335 [Candidatus Cloacimonadaceae bacterium]|nr:hypothetical protein [Candidatus Cloacimonadaceae bacterium]MDP3114380.1 hypothetical protein [Candidatus Cloacimonadaceae bacterium]
MQRILFMLVMMLTAMWLFGQKGLFGLSYGDSYAVAKDILMNNDAQFHEPSHTSNSSVFTQRIKSMWIA